MIIESVKNQVYLDGALLPEGLQSRITIHDANGQILKRVRYYDTLRKTVKLCLEGLSGVTVTMDRDDRIAVAEVEIPGSYLCIDGLRWVEPDNEADSFWNDAGADRLGKVYFSHPEVFNPEDLASRL